MSARGGAADELGDADEQLLDGDRTTAPPTPMRLAGPGELCECGAPAAVVYETGGPHGDVPHCGRDRPHAA
jgi:hypothetical protein